MNCNNCLHLDICVYNVAGRANDFAECNNFLDRSVIEQKAANTCSFGNVTICPDGKHALSPHKFVEEITLRNVTVQVLCCEKCGKVSIGWTRQDNTEEVE